LRCTRCPIPADGLSITEPEERLQVGLTQLYRWFEASEPVMTNSVRDFGLVQESAEAMRPVGEVFQRIYETLCQGWEGFAGVSPVVAGGGLRDMEEAPPRAGHAVEGHR